MKIRNLLLVCVLVISAMSFVSHATQTELQKFINEQLLHAAQGLQQSLENNDTKNSTDYLTTLKTILTKLDCQTDEVSGCLDSIQKCVNDGDFNIASDMWIVFCDAIKQPIKEIRFLEQKVNDLELSNKEKERSLSNISNGAGTLSLDDQKRLQEETENKFQTSLLKHRIEFFDGVDCCVQKLEKYYGASEYVRDIGLKNCQSLKNDFFKFKSKYANVAEKRLLIEQKRNIGLFNNIYEFLERTRLLRIYFHPNDPNSKKEILYKPYDFLASKLSFLSFYNAPMIGFFNTGITAVDELIKLLDGSDVKFSEVASQCTEKMKNLEKLLVGKIDHLKDVLEPKGFSLASLTKWISPEYYYASSLKDFLENNLEAIKNKKELLNNASIGPYVKSVLDTLNTMKKNMEQQRLDYMLSSLYRQDKSEVIGVQGISEQQMDTLKKQEEQENWCVSELLDIQAQEIQKKSEKIEQRKEQDFRTQFKFDVGPETVEEKQERKDDLKALVKERSENNTKRMIDHLPVGYLSYKEEKEKIANNKKFVWDFLGKSFFIAQEKMTKTLNSVEFLKELENIQECQGLDSFGRCMQELDSFGPRKKIINENSESFLSQQVKKRPVFARTKTNLQEFQQQFGDIFNQISPEISVDEIGKLKKARKKENNLLINKN